MVKSFPSRWGTIRRFLALAFRWGTIRRFLAVAFLAFLAYIPYRLYSFYVREVEMQFYNLHNNVSYKNKDGFECIIPDFDPLDPSIRKYFETAKPIRCGYNQPYLTYLDSEGYIHFNKTEVLKSGHNESDYDCSYSEITRPFENDDKATFGLPMVLKEVEKIGNVDSIRVTCLLRETGRLVYDNLHSNVYLPTGKLDKTTRRSKDGDKDQPSVLILAIDSMSRLNFMRQLPRTYEVLTKVINAIVFKGLTRTGHNTFPNLMPLLTGRKLERSTYYDDYPVAWKNFSANGYATMFNEDEPYISLFNYIASGFKYPPTDYYLHPFWLAVEEKKHFGSWDWRCSGNTPKHIYFLEYVKQFALRMKEHRYFALSFITGLSHQDLNLIQVADVDFAEAFLKIWQRGGLDNAVLIVMGDHGNRFSELRRTQIGRVESNMPFLAVRLPDGFKREFPHLNAGLQSNANNLLSWFDLYEMLMDLAYRNLGIQSRVTRYGSVGSSPFRKISKNRECSDIGIPWEYCICARETQLSPNDTRIEKVAQDLVYHINNNILKKSIEQGLCSPLALKQVLSGQQLTLGRQVTEPEDYRVSYRVTIEVLPSLGVFEGGLELDAWSKNAHSVGDVLRLNLYGKQSACVNDSLLRLYCFCNGFTNTTATSVSVKYE